MNRALAASLALFFIAGCAEKGPSTLAGYVEADLLYLAPQDGGIVKTLSVTEGAAVEAGAVLFTLDTDRASLSAAQAAAAAEGAAARASDQGSLDRQIEDAEAALALAERNYRRTASLLRDGHVSKARLDADSAAQKSARARLERARAERAASLIDWNAMDAAAKLAERRLADRTTTSPAAGVIERVYRRPGEFAGPGEPVVALLAPENLKLKFFAPQALLASLAIGGEIGFSCDGCATGLKAAIIYIASEPQFTPPVIYSIDEREKLVFLVEARPLDPAGLRPGLPVAILPP